MVVPIDKTKRQVYAGDDWSFSFQILTGDEENSTPTDLSEWDDWSAQWRAVPANDDGEIDLSVDTSQSDQGIITIKATDEQSRIMGSNEAPLGAFDVQAANPLVRTFFRGTTQWVQDVTRDE